MGKNTKSQKSSTVDRAILLKAFGLMCTARSMAVTYETNRDVCGKYVHSTSRGHEAIQIATGFHLTADDFASPYYRDDSLLLAIGLEPYELMLQLMAKRDDPFSGGRSYYAHPSLKREGFPIIPHQSSATGMQAIPATGMAHGISYLQSQKLWKKNNNSIVLCSLGDGSVTEGEVAEAFQMAVLKKLPILYLVQDNDWGISATGKEMRSMDAYEFVAGFKGMERMRVDGSDFVNSYEGLQKAVDYVRNKRAPMLVHAKCPLLGHHTSGVRMEWYRGDDLKEQKLLDPITKLENLLLAHGETKKSLDVIKNKAIERVSKDYQRAVASTDPDSADFDSHEFAATPIITGCGVRSPKNGEKVVMVDAALHAVEEILRFSPSIVTWRRRAKEDIEISGVSFKNGDNILLVMGSGNRDEAVFTEGDTFNIERPNAAQHLSMGAGIHFCLGAPLAKLEAKVVLEELTQRMPHLKLKPNQLFEFAYNTSFRAPVALKVEW